MSYASDEKVHLYSSVGGVITELIPHCGWRSSSKLGKVSLIYIKSQRRYLAYSQLEMVLFHASFVALKARCPLTINVNEEDYRLAGENRVFQGYADPPWSEHVSLTKPPPYGTEVC